ncbi:MAG: DUF1134 domain-containing protein [Parvibaculaceae bacterium]
MAMIRNGLGRRKLVTGLAAAGIALCVPMMSPQVAQGARAYNNDPNTFSVEEIVDAGHSFFGTTTKGLALAVESVFAKAGRPSGYIIGEEASGAFFGGLRYGEGSLFIKNGKRRKIYWQGPSVGFDFGGNGSRVLVLVYDIRSPGQIYDRFVGVEGSAYLVGGFGVNFQTNEALKLAPIRTGVGARLGANVGYLKYTNAPTWNPF